MSKTVLLLLFFLTPLFALDISLQGAKENHQSYSTLHISDKDKFLCQEFKDDFDNVIKIVCAFSKFPSQKIQKLQNSFFEIESEIKKETFFLIIKPYEKMKLVPIVFDLTKDETLFGANVELSNHWMIVGYKEKIPYMEQRSKNSSSLNLPFTAHDEKLPYVGSLDIKGNPVHIKRVGDVTEYLKIKRLYEEKNYEFALELAEDVLKEYKNSLFRAELLFYKIRIYAQLKANEKLIETAKEYLRDYSSDENVAEVLSLIAKSYDKIGLNSDADYFYDRLFSEHPDSVYAKWGYIYMAEVIEEGGGVSKAQGLYEKALKETDNIDVAVEAAFKLARMLLSNAKTQEAAKHIEKISLAKPDFFMQNKTQSMEMMYEFVDNNDFISAATIAKALVAKMDYDDDAYEGLVKNAGVWLSQSNKKEEALVALNKYAEIFPDGIYLQDVKVAKDALFFDVSDQNESNVTAKLAMYDTLMQEYPKDRIGDKALYEKAKLLIAQKKFQEALALEVELQALDKVEYGDVPELVVDAAIGAMQESLETKECNKVLQLASKYQIELSAQWDDGIYECAMKGADFLLAKKMADRNLKSKELEQRKKWLYRYIKIDFATGNYTNVIEASKELIALIAKEENSAYKDVYRVVFDTYHRLENTQKMIESMAKVVEVYGEEYLDSDRYAAMMTAGGNTKDINLVITYGEKILRMQKSSGSLAQTPFVEFALHEAYTQKEDYAKALDVIKMLDAVELDKNQRARQKYLLGSVLAKLWRDAESDKAYQEAIDADPASAWAGLAKSAKEL
ncbi:tetratricopeptide repeat protein [Sulfurimonas sp.]|uniref:tetratricopeptide repeat protein n=1 Tax=Sulfurimonas sp. TaxID=2022749 RepID=UPI003D14EE42